MVAFRLSVLCVFVATAIATPVARQLLQHGPVLRTAPSLIPSAWQRLGEASGEDLFNFTVALKGADMEGLTDRMNDIAEMGGSWLTDEELDRYVRAPAMATNALRAFLKQEGIPDQAISTNKYGYRFTITSTISETSRIFSANFTTYEVAGVKVPRTKAFVIPAAIAPYVADIYPLTNYGSTRHMTAAQNFEDLNNRPDDLSSTCNTSSVTPNCLRSYYGVGGYSPSKGSSRPDIGVMGYIDQWVSQADLSAFNKKFAPQASHYEIPIKLSYGAQNDQKNPGIEAMLDVETVVSQTFPLNSTFFAVGNGDTQGDIFLITFDDFVNNYDAKTRPKVITVSYGADEINFNQEQATWMCQGAQMLSALGTTIVVSSGDEGVAGQRGDTCPPFVPTYPSGCPYVLSVGATQGFAPEVMVDLELAGFYSGAAASNHFSVPSYQDKQVRAYQQAIGDQGGAYNKSGRVFPDLAAQGSKYAIISKNQTGTVGGTSASAPLVASFLTLINDKRSKVGKDTIGWPHPSLYKTMLHDITRGGSYGCGDGRGFPAREGWDGSAGQGSPIFELLSKTFAV